MVELVDLSYVNRIRARGTIARVFSAAESPACMQAVSGRHATNPPWERVRCVDIAEESSTFLRRRLFLRETHDPVESTRSCMTEVEQKASLVNGRAKITCTTTIEECEVTASASFGGDGIVGIDWNVDVIGERGAWARAGIEWRVRGYVRRFADYMTNVSLGTNQFVPYDGSCLDCHPL